MAFPRCAFSSASSSFLFDNVHTCNGCICLCVSKCALKFLGSEMQDHIVRICENFPYCVYSDVHLNGMHARLHTTHCHDECRSLSEGVIENLTLHRMNKIFFSFYHQKEEIRSFPAMYNTWGSSLGRYGSNKSFIQKSTLK